MADTTYEYLDSFLDEKRQQGQFTFTAKQAKKRFDLSGNAFKKTTQRLLKQTRIARLRQNFYLIIPPEFAARQTLPLGYFVDDLMKFLERNYYVGLLTAAMYHGAAHQQPQKQYVVTEKPYLRPIKNQQFIVFCMKKGWDRAAVQQQKTDAGFINISNPALTALDLVFYVNRVGGFNRAATVLAELIPALDEEELSEAARRFNQTTTLQRLGYLLDKVLNQPTLSKVIYDVLNTRSCYPTALSPATETQNQRSPNKWKIIPNLKVETEI